MESKLGSVTHTLNVVLYLKILCYLNLSLLVQESILCRIAQLLGDIPKSRTIVQNVYDLLRTCFDQLRGSLNNF